MEVAAQVAIDGHLLAIDACHQAGVVGQLVGALAGSQPVRHEAPADARVLDDGPAGRQRLEPARGVDVLPGARAAHDQIEEQTRGHRAEGHSGPREPGRHQLRAAGERTDIGQPVGGLEELVAPALLDRADGMVLTHPLLEGVMTRLRVRLATGGMILSAGQDARPVSERPDVVIGLGAIPIEGGREGRLELRRQHVAGDRRQARLHGGHQADRRVGGVHDVASSDAVPARDVETAVVDIDHRGVFEDHTACRDDVRRETVEIGERVELRLAVEAERAPPGGRQQSFRHEVDVDAEPAPDLRLAFERGEVAAIVDVAVAGNPGEAAIRAERCRGLLDPLDRFVHGIRHETRRRFPEAGHQRCVIDVERRRDVRRGGARRSRPDPSPFEQHDVQAFGGEQAGQAQPGDPASGDGDLRLPVPVEGREGRRPSGVALEPFGACRYAHASLASASAAPTSARQKMGEPDAT